MKRILTHFMVLTGLWSQTAVQIMSPEPDEQVPGNNILIAASFYGLEGLIVDNIQLSIDEEDITDQAFVDPDMVSYLIPSLEPGEHWIELVTGDWEPVVWSFTVSGVTDVQVKPMEYSGRVRSSSSLDQIDEESLSISQVMFDMRGTAYEWLKFKSNIKLTTQENDLFQSRNVYGFGFQLGDFATVNIGDANPRLSYFTMSGKRIRGVEANLKLGFLNLHVIQGEINRAVQGDLDKAYSYSVATDEDGMKYLSLARTGYTFKQRVLAGRLALGRGKNFQWGVSFLKARDDTASITGVLDDGSILFTENPGTIVGLDSGTVYTVAALGSNAQVLDGKNWSGTGPKDNIVLGSDIGIYLDKKRVVLEGEVAFSLINNNIWGGPLTKAGMDTLLDDSVDNKVASFDLEGLPDPADFVDILIINPNLVPLIPIDIYAFGDSATVDLNDAILSMPSLAYRGRAVINYFGNYLSVEYSQVGPGFNSLANPYLVKNKRELSISDKLKLFQNRLMITAGYKHQDDDILTTIANVQSQNTLSLGMNVLPGPGLPTANFTYRSIDRNNGIENITVLTDTTFNDNRGNTHTDNLMLNVNHRFNLIWDHNLSGTFVKLDKMDQVIDRDPNDRNFVDPGVTSNVINLSLMTRYNSPLKTNMTITTNSTELSIGPGARGTQDFLTGSLGGEFGLSDGNIQLKAGINFAQGSGLVDMSWIGFKGGLRMKILGGLNLNAQGEFRAKESGGETRNSLIARASLDYAF